MTQSNESMAQEPTASPTPYVYAPVDAPQPQQDLITEEQGLSPAAAVGLIIICILLIANFPFGFLFAIALIYAAVRYKKKVPRGTKATNPSPRGNKILFVLLVILVSLIALAEGFMQIVINAVT